MHFDIIMHDETIIGYADDILFHLSDDLERGRIDDPDEACLDILFAQLQEHHYSLVKCTYLPMGSWCVVDLVEA